MIYCLIKTGTEGISVRKQKMIWIGIAVVTVFCAMPDLGQEDIRQERVQFKRGTSSTTIKGDIKGYGTIDYLLNARVGQTMTVTMTTDNGANYFNILPPDTQFEAIYVGSTGGNEYEGRPDLDGDWKIRVYMMRSAARRKEVANYTRRSASPAPQTHLQRARPTILDRSSGMLAATWAAPSGALRCSQQRIRSRSYAHPTEPLCISLNRMATALESSILKTVSGQPTRRQKLKLASSHMWVLIVEEETYEIPDAVLTGG